MGKNTLEGVEEQILLDESEDKKSKKTPTKMKKVLLFYCIFCSYRYISAQYL